MCYNECSLTPPSVDVLLLFISAQRNSDKFTRFEDPTLITMNVISLSQVRIASIFVVLMVKFDTGVALWLQLNSFHARSQSCGKRIFASLCLSVRPHGTLFPLGVFSWYFVFEYISKTCRENSSYTKFCLEQRVLYMMTCVLTYWLTPWSRVHLEKLTGSAASQEIPRTFGTRRFLTVLPSARHLSLSWANSI